MSIEQEKRILVGYLCGSDSDSLPESASELQAKTFEVLGNNDLVKLIDQRRFEVAPILITPDYYARRWRYDFSRYDVVVNGLSDVDVNPTSVLLAVAALADIDRPVVNDPRRMALARRDVVSGLLAGIAGLTVPRTIRIAPPADPVEAAVSSGLRYPILMRPAGTHTGRGLVKADDPAALSRAWAGSATPGAHYLSEYVEFRSADGLYRKMRLFVVGDEVILRHLLPSDSWLIHAGSADFMRDRPELQQQEADAMRLPASYLPAGAERIIRAVKSRLGLDYFGIDCARLADGGLLLFEANATMNMLPASGDPARRPRMLAAIGRAQEAATRLIEARLSTAG